MSNEKMMPLSCSACGCNVWKVYLNENAQNDMEKSVCELTVEKRICMNCNGISVFTTTFDNRNAKAKGPEENPNP